MQLTKYTSYKHDEYESDRVVSCVRRGGITIMVKIEEDIYPDLSWYGEFSDSAKDSTSIRVPEQGDRPDDWDRRECWFTPGYTHFGGYTKLARHQAHELARHHTLQNMRSLLEHYRGDRFMAVVSVKIKINNKTIGEASCGGVDLSNYTDQNQEYLEETTFDLVREALEEAIKFVQSLGGDASALQRLDRAYDRLENRRRLHPRDPLLYKKWRDLSQDYQKERKFGLPFNVKAQIKAKARKFGVHPDRLCQACNGKGSYKVILSEKRNTCHQCGGKGYK